MSPHHPQPRGSRSACDVHHTPLPHGPCQTKPSPLEEDPGSLPEAVSWQNVAVSLSGAAGKQLERVRIGAVSLFFTGGNVGQVTPPADAAAPYVCGIRSGWLSCQELWQPGREMG